MSNANDLTLPANTLSQVESLLYTLEQTARNTGLNMKSENTESMCFNHVDSIS